MVRSRLLTEKEVEAWLGIKCSTLRSMRSKPGRDPIPFTKVGRLIRYPEPEVQKWIERHTYRSTGEIFDPVELDEK
jgi:predicted DNA-binding transcriptional regulator AlpA